MLGKFNARLKLHGREEIGPVYVTEENLNVLGSDWMEELDLWNVSIASICNQIQNNDTQLTKTIVNKFPEIFKDGLGLCTKMKASFFMNRLKQEHLRTVKFHANQMKQRYTILTDEHNVLMEDFDLPQPMQREIEPEMQPEEPMTTTTLKMLETKATQEKKSLNPCDDQPERPLEFLLIVWATKFLFLFSFSNIPS